MLALAVLAAVTLGAVACLLTGRTLAHVLSIAMMAGYVALPLYLTDRYLPMRGDAAVRRWTAGISLAGFAWIVLFHLWHYGAARYVYIFDDSLYYYQQLELAHVMNTGLKDTLTLCWRSVGTDYTRLPNLLLAPLFSLTDRSIQAHGLCGVVLSWGLLQYQLRRFTAHAAQELRCAPRQAVLLHAGMVLICCALPVLHKATSACQVNLLGLPVFLTIVLLSWHFGFRKLDKTRALCLFLCVLTLVLMRRWFIFLLAGYLVFWGGRTVIRLLRQRDFPALLNLTGYGLLCTLAGLTLLWPLFRHAVSGNYAQTYHYWKGDGLLFELKNQTWRVGLGVMLLTATGYLWGLLQRRSKPLRALTIVMGGSGGLALFLFDRIQSMNAHQVTILMPMYAFGLFLLFAAALTLRRTGLRIALCALLSGLLLGQYALCLTQERPQDVSPLLPHDSLVPPVRDDFAAIGEVADFVDANCSADAQALFLCNSNLYDRLTFVNIRYPDLSMRQKVSLQRIALPSDGFPTAWFSARYYLVPSAPQTNQPGGTVEKLTDFLLQDDGRRFRLVHSVDFGEFMMYVLERTGPAQWDEVEALEVLFAEENAAHPHLWQERIRQLWQQQ